MGHATDITLESLLAAGVHVGHRTSRWHPKMAPYIFAAKSGVYLIDLEKTREQLIAATEFVRTLTAKGGTVLFVATKRHAQPIVRAAAERSGSYYLVERWIGGLFTNFGVVGKAAAKLRRLKAQRDSGELSRYTKKERLSFDKEITKLTTIVGGIEGLEKLPDAVVLTDTKEDRTVVREARAKHVPIVAIVDTSNDPTKVDWPIPANDDAVKSIELITNCIADAIIAGRAERVSSGPATPPTTNA